MWDPKMADDVIMMSDAFNAVARAAFQGDARHRFVFFFLLNASTHFVFLNAERHFRILFLLIRI